MIFYRNYVSYIRIRVDTFGKETDLVSEVLEDDVNLYL